MNQPIPETTVIEFRVYGRPASKGSFQAFGHGGFRPDDRELAYWQDNVREAVARLMAEPGAVRLVGCAVAFEATWYIFRPMAHHGDELYSAEKPDLDKLERAVFDGITKGGAWRDDKQVARNVTEKRYVTASESEGVAVRLSVLELKT